MMLGLISFPPDCRLLQKDIPLKAPPFLPNLSVTSITFRFIYFTSNIPAIKATCTQRKGRTASYYIPVQKIHSTSLIQPDSRKGIKHAICSRLWVASSDKPRQRTERSARYLRRSVYIYIYSLSTLGFQHYFFPHIPQRTIETNRKAPPSTASHRAVALS